METVVYIVGIRVRLTAVAVAILHIRPDACRRSDDGVSLTRVSTGRASPTSGSNGITSGATVRYGRVDGQLPAQPRSGRQHQDLVSSSSPLNREQVAVAHRPTRRYTPQCPSQNNNSKLGRTAVRL